MKKLKQPLKKPEIRPILVNFRIPLAAVVLVMGVWTYAALSTYYKSAMVSTAAVSAYFNLAHVNSSFHPGTLFALIPHFTSILYALLILFAAYAPGTMVCRLFSTGANAAARPAQPGSAEIRLTTLERFLFSILCGLAVLIPAFFLIGIAGFFYKAVALSLVLLLDIWGAALLLRTRKETGGMPREPLRFSGFEKLWLLFGICAGFVILVACFSPETFYDSLVYHIAKPNFWVQNHRIVPDEALLTTAFMPGNSSILFSLGLFFKDETVCKSTSYLFMLLTCLVIYAAGNRFSGRRAGLMGAMLFMAMPSAIILSYRSGVEMQLAFYEFFSVFACLLWFTSGEKKWLIAAGIAAGLGLGTKYLSLYNAFALGSAVVAGLLYLKRPLRELPGSLAALAGTALAVSLPWLLYNFSYTGNPTYPFFRGLIGHMSPKPVPDPATVIASSSRWISSLKDIAWSPWTISMGRYEEAFIGPLLLLFLPLFLLAKSRWKPALPLFLYFIVYGVLWGVMTSPLYVRYFIPAFATISFLCAFYFVEAPLSHTVKNVFCAVMTFVMAGNILFAMNLQKFSNNCLGMVLGMESKEEYLNRGRPTYPNPYYGAAAWINENAPRDATVMVIGEMRSYYIRRKAIMCDISDNIPLITWAGEAKDTSDLYRKLKEKNVTHILFSVPETRRLASYDLINFEPGALTTFSRFWNTYVREAARSLSDTEALNQGIFSLRRQQPQWWQNYASSAYNYVYVYEVMSEEEARKPHQPPFNFFLTPVCYKAERWAKLEPVVKTIIQDTVLKPVKS